MSWMYVRALHIGSCNYFYWGLSKLSPDYFTQSGVKPLRNIKAKKQYFEKAWSLDYLFELSQENFSRWIEAQNWTVKEIPWW